MNPFAFSATEQAPPLNRTAINAGESLLSRSSGRRFLLPLLALSFLPAVLLIARPQPEQRNVNLDAAASAPAVAPHYSHTAEPDPDGIGKIYMGREIARVMGHQGIDWLERPERNREERTAMLVDLLKFRPGEDVADVGAGSGHFTRQIAPRVAPEGRVFAVDIQPEMLQALTNQLNSAGITNVVPVLGTTTHPTLPRGSIDTVLLVDVYHEFSHPYEMVRALCDSLRPGGRMVFVEYRAEDRSVPIKALHKMSEQQVRLEMSVHPLAWTTTLTNLPRQHVILFEKAPGRE